MDNFIICVHYFVFFLLNSIVHEDNFFKYTEIKLRGKIRGGGLGNADKALYITISFESISITS